MTAMETNGDGSEGTSPARQGARTETSVPRNSSTVAAELRNCSGNFADPLRVFDPEALYRRRGVVRGLPGRPHNGCAQPGAGPRPPVVWAASGPPPALFQSSVLFREK
jgi:hypothetical protein